MKPNLKTIIVELRKKIRKFESENVLSSYKLNTCYHHLKKTLKKLRDFEAELLELLFVAKLKPKEDIFAKAIEYFIEKEILKDE